MHHVRVNFIYHFFGIVAGIVADSPAIYPGAFHAQVNLIQ